MLITIAVFLVIIGIAISVHEIGHFVAARIAGIQVDEFAIGFGPKLFVKKIKGTNYILKLFPIGGSVSLLGEEETVKNKNSFSEKSYGLKVLVALGGIIMNFVLAVLVFYAVLIHQDFIYSGFPYYEDMNLVFGEQTKSYAYPPIILEVQEGGGAEKAGLEEYDQIIKVCGEKVESAEELKEYLEKNPSRTVEIEYIDVEENRGTVEVEVNSEGKIGIAPSEDIAILKVEYKGVGRYFSGFSHSVNMVHANIFLIGKVIEQSVDEGDVQPVADAVSGPIGLLAITDVVREFGGFWGLLELMGVLSIALMVTNLIPLPGLDGSHVIIMTIEKIRGKPLNEKLKGVVFGIGMALLFLLAFLVAIKDVVQFGIWDWIKDLFN